MTIAILTRLTKNDLEDINALLPQIAERPHFMTSAECAKVVGQKHCRFAVARENAGGRSVIVGIAFLAFTHLPTGLIAEVEDVVVDEHFRGRGIGRKLVQKLVDIAKRSRAKHVSLHTNPSRLAANALYQHMGFEKKETNFYRINLHLPKPASAREIRKLSEKRVFLKSVEQ